MQRTRERRFLGPDYGLQTNNEIGFFFRMTDVLRGKTSPKTHEIIGEH